MCIKDQPQGLRNNDALRSSCFDSLLSRNGFSNFESEIQTERKTNGFVKSNSLTKTEKRRNVGMCFCLPSFQGTGVRF